MEPLFKSSKRGGINYYNNGITLGLSHNINKSYTFLSLIKFIENNKTLLENKLSYVFQYTIEIEFKRYEDYFLIIENNNNFQIEFHYLYNNIFFSAKLHFYHNFNVKEIDELENLMMFLNRKNKIKTLVS